MKALVPLDLEDRPAALLRHAESWARHFGARLHLRTSHPSASAESDLRQLLQSLPEAHRGDVARWSRSPEESIATDAPDFDLVIMSTHGRTGVARWWTGSVTEGAVRHVHVPLLVVRTDKKPHRGGELRVACPVDADEPHLEAAARVTSWATVDLHLIYALPERTMLQAMAGVSDDHAAWAMRKLEGPLDQAGLSATLHRARGVHRDPTEALLASAQALAADLIVLSSHQRTGLARWWHGSVAEQLVRQAPTPVLVVPMAPA